MTVSDTPVWDVLDGDREWDRLRRDWDTTRQEARLALARFGSWEELTRTDGSKTGKGSDVLIPPQRKLLPSQGGPLILGGHDGRR